MISSSNLATVFMFSFLTGLAIISTARGCTPLPPGQGRRVNFNVGGFTVPAAMAYSADIGVQTTVPQISKTPGAAMALVNNLIIEAVIAVLEENGRNALLPGFVISAILDQLTITVNYTPVNCAAAYTMAMNQANGVAMGCFVINDIVTTICDGANCDPTMNMMVSPLPAGSTTISGFVTTTNLIMAGWSRQMWQSIFNKALQMVRRGPFGNNFAGAFVTVM